MKLAIHNSGSWNEKWKNYCEKENINFVSLNCYDSDIIKQLKENEITHLMWHFHHSKAKDILMARNVLYSASKMGIKTFPDFNTCWHFDDKVSQKYLLEAIEAPLVPSYAFYDRKETIFWLKTKAKYPLVAKLRRGAGSYNVVLLKDFRDAKKYTKKMFGSGIHPTPGYIADVKNKLKVAGNLEGVKRRLKKVPNYFKMVLQGKKDFPREKGYVFFQDFLEGNKEDLRIGIVGNKLWAVKRKVRENDFRASGSGMPSYDYSDITKELIEQMFYIYKKIGVQSMSFDLVKDKYGKFLIVEISYGFLSSLFYEAPGYWNDYFMFIQESLKPEDVIIEQFIK